MESRKGCIGGIYSVKKLHSFENGMLLKRTPFEAATKRPLPVRRAVTDEVGHAALDLVPVAHHEVIGSRSISTRVTAAPGRPPLPHDGPLR